MSINFNGGWLWHAETLCGVIEESKSEELDIEEAEMRIEMRKSNWRSF